MEFEFAPGHMLQQGRLNVIVAPVETFTKFFNENLNFQRFVTLYISGNYSRILTNINRTATRFDVRRAFTSYQLLSILKENYHTVVIFEYDPGIFDGDARMKDIISEALQEVAHSSIVIVYSPKMDPILSRMLKGVKRLFFYGISEEFSPGDNGIHRKRQGNSYRQITLN